MLLAALFDLPIGMIHGGCACAPGQRPLALASIRPTPPRPDRPTFRLPTFRPPKETFHVPVYDVQIIKSAPAPGGYVSAIRCPQLGLKRLRSKAAETWAARA